MVRGVGAAFHGRARRLISHLLLERENYLCVLTAFVFVCLALDPFFDFRRKSHAALPDQGTSPFVTLSLSHPVPLHGKRNLRHACVMATDDVQLRIRLDPLLKGRLESAAAAEGRSLNAEISRRLRSSFDNWSFSSADTWKDRIFDLEMKIRRCDEDLNEIRTALTELDRLSIKPDILVPMITDKLLVLQKDRNRFLEERRQLSSMLENSRRN